MESGAGRVEIFFPLPEEEEKAEEAAEKVYDVAIVGAGPAGFSAAVYAARKKLDTLLIAKSVGGQIHLASVVENYLGFKSISGPDLVKRFEEHVRDYENVTFRLGEELERIAKEGDLFALRTKGGKEYRARAVIVATGRRHKVLGVPGEREFTGKGVSYCSICDAPLFKGKPVAIVGGGNSGMMAVLDLAPYSPKIYLVEILERLTADPVLVERAEATGKVEFLLKHRVEEIEGDQTVRAIRVRNLATGEERRIEVQGVFIEVGTEPNSEFLKGFVNLTDSGEVVVDERCRTSVPGVFAAGDVTTVPEKQAIVAAGEGAKAALSAHRYLMGEGR